MQLRLNQLKYSKEAFDKARTNATNNDALNEFAVTADGKLVVQNDNGDIKFATLSEVKEGKLNPITNEQLLNLRAYHPELAL